MAKQVTNPAVRAAIADPAGVTLYLRCGCVARYPFTPAAPTYLVKPCTPHGRQIMLDRAGAVSDAAVSARVCLTEL